MGKKRSEINKCDVCHQTGSTRGEPEPATKSETNFFSWLNQPAQASGQ